MSSSRYVTWVVVADAHVCRMYHYSEKDKHLELFKELDHPENRLKDTDLTSDRLGQYGSGSVRHGVYSHHSDPKEVNIDDFAREISKKLKDGQTKNAYKKLILLAAPQMNGLLSQHMDKHVKDLITQNINKNAVHLKTTELLDVLRTNT